MLLTQLGPAAAATPERSPATSATRATAPPAKMTERRAGAAYGKLPVTFVPNAGQLDSRVLYAAQGGGHSFFFTREEAVFVLSQGTSKTARGTVLRLRFVGANPEARVEARQPAPGKVNYLIGKDRSRWHTNLSTYAELVYHDLWPGIDMLFRGGSGRLKYEFHVRPGASVSDIRLAYRGAEGLSVARAGDLLIRTPLGVIRDERPISYQELGGKRVGVQSRFALRESSGARLYGFAVGRYDSRSPLVVDPGLVYSTFLGGAGHDNGLGVAVDAAGSAYVTGYTYSTGFPTTAGAYDSSHDGGQDAFVTKLDTLAVLPVPASVTLTPATDTNRAGEEHCVTATVKDAFGNPVSGVSVVFSVSGANTAGGTETTDASGQAVFCYTGTKAGLDTINAFADTDGSGVQNGTEPTGAATKTYVAAAPATLVLTPAAATNVVGTQHCVTATVKDAFGNPVSGVQVRFSVTGSVTRTGTQTTNGNGQATFCYTGPELPGSDAIRAYADSNGDNVQDAGEPAGAATKTWTVPVTPLCQVSITNGGRITANNGDKATFGGNAQVPQSGQPKGNGEYQDHGPAVTLKVKSTKILAVVCSADKKQPSIYGQATINGSGSYFFKIDVKDVAEPGVGKDTYRILLSNGYDSGERTLEGGNIQIRIG